MNQKGTVTLAAVGGLTTVVSPLPIHQLIVAAAPSATGTDWVSLLQTFGPFLPFAVLCLVIMQILWKKQASLEEQLKAAQELTINKVVPALTDTNALLSKNTEELARATEVMRASNSRPEMDPDVWRRVVNALERSERGDHR